jgi:hypothetical protein
MNSNWDERRDKERGDNIWITDHFWDWLLQSYTSGAPTDTTVTVDPVYSERVGAAKSVH